MKIGGGGSDLSAVQYLSTIVENCIHKYGYIILILTIFLLAINSTASASASLPVD